MKFLAMVLALVISAEAVKVKSHDAEKSTLCWAGQCWDDTPKKSPKPEITCRWEKGV